MPICFLGESLTLDYLYDEYFDDICVTISGSKSNEPCMFPFIFKGQQFNNCITGSKRTNPWCATQVDAFGNYIRGHWGYCGVNCPLGVVAINTGSIFPKSSIPIHICLYVFQISKYLDLFSRFINYFLHHENHYTTYYNKYHHHQKKYNSHNKKYHNYNSKNYYTSNKNK